MSVKNDERMEIKGGDEIRKKIETQLRCFQKNLVEEGEICSVCHQKSFNGKYEVASYQIINMDTCCFYCSDCLKKTYSIT